MLLGALAAAGIVTIPERNKNHHQNQLHPKAIKKKNTRLRGSNALALYPKVGVVIGVFSLSLLAEISSIDSGGQVISIVFLPFHFPCGRV